MNNDSSLEYLQMEYDQTKIQLIAAVGNAENKEEIERLKRELENLAAKIRKLDVNRKL
jgi:hypothetical protein